VKYAVHNLARYSKFVQRVVGTLPQSYYYGKTFTSPFITAGPYTNDSYGFHFDSGTNTNQPATMVSGSTPYVFPANTPYLYVPENNNDNSLTWGQASYYAINAHYRPSSIVTAVNFNSGLQLSTTAIYPGTGYVFLRRDIAGSRGIIQRGTFFQTVALLQQAAWLCLYADNTPGGGWAASAHQLAQANALIDPCPPATVPMLLPDYGAYGYYVFSLPNPVNSTGGNWYRAAIGDPNNPNPYYKYGVFRGKAYEGVITSINGPGLPYEWMLLGEESNVPVEAQTHITANVQIRQWEQVQQVISLY
ncbi:MAG: hypothetical protein FWD56_05955, partial [Bacteroidales bacterium]|nr:hypothetical protein [Bacteroidales bacterium]